MIAAIPPPSPSPSPSPPTSAVSKPSYRTLTSERAVKLIRETSKQKKRVADDHDTADEDASDEDMARGPPIPVADRPLLVPKVPRVPAKPKQVQQAAPVQQSPALVPQSQPQRRHEENPRAFDDQMIGEQRRKVH